MEAHTAQRRLSHARPLAQHAPFELRARQLCAPPHSRSSSSAQASHSLTPRVLTKRPDSRPVHLSSYLSLTFSSSRLRPHSPISHYLPAPTPAYQACEVTLPGPRRLHCMYITSPGPEPRPGPSTDIDDDEPLEDTYLTPAGWDNDSDAAAAAILSQWLTPLSVRCCRFGR